MVKRRIGCIAIAIVILLLSVFGLVWGNKKASQKKGIERIENAMGISLPKDAKLGHQYYSASMDGSFTQYTIMVLQEQPTDILNNFQFTVRSDPSWKEGCLREFRSLKIPEKYTPNLEEAWMSGIVGFYNHQGFTAIYLPDTLRLVFTITYVS